ncbi:hypothetical protein DPMN_135374 [Dreissena polymorpha]|uniref:Cytochrome P450 n=1 Tax=Dreissena polymorpha TaxID=45954 RepID=A0A9D4G1E8_DREPO|nr:hypothetical protein DPMN_135374 [Dreissena polymorpha]
MEIFGYPVQLSDVCWTLLVLFAVSSIYDWVGWIIWKYKYNIKGTFPVPIFGIFLDFLLHPSADDAKRRMLKYGPVQGGNAGHLKMIIVQDVDLMKKVLITNHAQFQNRYSLMGLYYPPPADKTLLELKDGEWKRVRSIVTPSFSSGKLKMMSTLISHCSETLVKGLVEQAKKGAVIEPRKHFGCYTMDVIASTAFGIETDSYNNPEDPFIQNAQKVFTTSTFDPLIILSMLYPRFGTLLVNLFGYSAYWPKGPLQFFSDVTKKVIDGRQKDGDHNRWISFS